MAAADGHYHLHVHVISKLKGHSVRAAAAYRRAERFGSSIVEAAAYRRAQELGNEGEVFDYRRKMGIAWTGIMAPDCTPEHLRNAQTLWNTVERIESRTNARMAREVIIALPHQVGLDVHVAMLRAFVGRQFVARGMIADVAIHEPPVQHGGDPRNWHAHVLLTDRPMTPDGFAAKKDRTWNARENVRTWREAWTEMHNRTMEHLGLPFRIDHRSLVDQRREAVLNRDEEADIQLARLPQIHLGKAAHATHPRFSEYRERLERNRQILALNAASLEERQRRADHKHADLALAALREHDQITYAKATWQPPPHSIDVLRAHYGRTNSPLTRAMQPRIMSAAKAIATAMTWSDDDPAANDADVSWFLTTETKLRRQRPAWHSVSTRDLAFAFYGMGLITLRNLQDTLAGVWDIEIKLFPDRILPKSPLPRPPGKPPDYPRPMQAALRRIDRTHGFITADLDRRHARQAAFDRRYVQRAWTKALRNDRVTVRLRDGGRLRVPLTLPSAD